jgi:hypothetical protein
MLAAARRAAAGQAWGAMSRVRGSVGRERPVVERGWVSQSGCEGGWR